MKTEILHLTEAGLSKLTAALREKGARVVAPVETGRAAGGKIQTDYREISDAGEAALGGPLPRRSLKELFLPATEELLRWRRQKGTVSIEPASTIHPRTVVLGAHPCDVAALPILDAVMGWDYRDEPWFGRREATTIIARACSGGDASCFCTAVGLSPDSGRGADILLVPRGDENDHLVEILTPAGEALVAAHRDIFEAAPDSSEADARRRSAKARVSKNLDVDPEAIRRWLEKNFEAEVWKKIADRCHGCGACAAVCPTCHCFDIVDEPEGMDGGTRRRNWDTCQTALFTLHGSGHNPRETQVGRFRQRVMHKFAIYPKRFEEILCTGCGRCARACAAGMDLPEILRELNRLAVNAESKPAQAGGAR